MSGKFWNMVLEKDGEYQLDRSCEKWRSITKSQGEEKYPTKKKEKKNGRLNWICHVLRQNCILKHVIEGMIQRRIKLNWRRGRRCKQLLDDLKEKTGYWKLKEETLHRPLCRTPFGRGYGPVMWRTPEWMNIMIDCINFITSFTEYFIVFFHALSSNPVGLYICMYSLSGLEESA